MDLLGIFIRGMDLLGVFIRRKYLQGCFHQENGPIGCFYQENGPTGCLYQENVLKACFHPKIGPTGHFHQENIPTRAFSLGECSYCFHLVRILTGCFQSFIISDITVVFLFAVTDQVGVAATAAAHAVFPLVVHALNENAIAVQKGHTHDGTFQSKYCTCHRQTKRYEKRWLEEAGIHTLLSFHSQSVTS